MRANKRKSGKFEHSAKGAARRWGAKSVLTLCLAAAFAVALTIGGTLAYLKNKTDTVTNTFRAGQIQYKLNLEPNAQLVNHQNEDVTMPGNLVAEQTNTATSVDFTYDNHPTMPGYTFDGWYYDKDCEEEYTDFSEKTITVNYGDEHDSHTAPNKVEITLYAKWTANTDTPYTVRHWVQKLNAGKEHTEANFDLRDTEHLTGTTDTEVTPADKN